jgi:hypothetical protein
MARILWLEASERADSEGYKTVKTEHVEDAYDDLFEPHELLQTTAQEIEDLATQIEDVKERSPIYKEWSSNEE